MLQKIYNSARKIKHNFDKCIYNVSGKKPWSRGYETAKFEYISRVIDNKELMSKFCNNEQLPGNYGIALDERVVEYPWVISRLEKSRKRLLDAGSVFNFETIIDKDIFQDKDLTIVTLAPEPNAFNAKKISYVYCDLRQLPFRDDWFDEINCLSTLGHVGMDNKNYTGQQESTKKVNLEAEKATSELLRVLKPDSKLFISVVFGKNMQIEWGGVPYAEQFDEELLNTYLKIFEGSRKVDVFFYKYDKSGWNITTIDQCKDLEYYNIHTSKSYDEDMAAAARAVALIEVVK